MKNEPEIIVLAPVGASDLCCALDPGDQRFGTLGLRPGQPPTAVVSAWATDLCCDSTLYDITEALAKLTGQDLQARLARCRWPILRPALKSVLEDVRHIDRLLFVVTDQGLEAGPHRNNDTVHVGTLLAHLIRRDTALSKAVGIIQPAFLTVRSHPERRDDMFRLVRTHLRDHLSPMGVARLFVLISPGIPAISDALHRATLTLYRGRHANRAQLKIMQVTQPRENPDGAAEGVVVEVPIDAYLQEIIRGTAETLVRRTDFAGALKSIEEYDSSRRMWPEELYLRLEHAQARSDLDFERAALVARRLGLERGGAIPPAAEVLGRLNEMRMLIVSDIEHSRFYQAALRLRSFQHSAARLFMFGALGSHFYGFAMGRELDSTALREQHPKLFSALNSKGFVRGKKVQIASPDAERCIKEYVREIKKLVTTGSQHHVNRGHREEAWSRVARLVWFATPHLQDLRDSAAHFPQGVSGEAFQAALRKDFRANTDAAARENLVAYLKDVPSRLGQTLGVQLPSASPDPIPEILKLLECDLPVSGT